MTLYHSSKTPTEVLTAELRDVHGMDAPLYAAGLVAGLRVEGYIIVRENAIARAQREAIAAYLEDKRAA